MPEPYTNDELDALHRTYLRYDDANTIHRLLATIAQRDATITTLSHGLRPAGIIWRRGRSNKWFWRHGVGDRPGLARDPEVEIVPLFRIATDTNINELNDMVKRWRDAGT